MLLICYTGFIWCISLHIITRFAKRAIYLTTHNLTCEGGVPRNLVPFFTSKITLWLGVTIHTVATVITLGLFCYDV